MQKKDVGRIWGIREAQLGVYCWQAALKMEHFVLEDGRGAYELALSNKEVRLMFEEMVEEWFGEYTTAYNEFVKASLLGIWRL